MHAGKCFFQEGDVSRETRLSLWYSNKLEQIGEGNYEKHLHCKDSLGNTLLHGAVYAEDLDSLKSMVSLETVDLDVRNNTGFTPLLVCLNKHFKPELARCLIEAGCDVNLTHGPHNTTPLIVVADSYHNAEIAHLLVKHGADINARNTSDDTALHYAVCESQYEIICMLLYYGADADEPNETNETPFQIALSTRDTDTQDLLFDYVTEMRGSALLMLALENGSPYYSQLLAAGAEVNFYCLALSLDMPNNKAFKLVWERLDYEAVYQHSFNKILTTLCRCGLPNEDWLECLRILLASKRTENIVQHYLYTTPTFMITLVSRFVWCFSRRGLPERAFHEYVCLFLTRGEPVYFTDVEAVYLTYGYGETLKLLLQMDVVPNFCNRWPLLHFVCNVSRSESEVMSGPDMKQIVLFRSGNADEQAELVLKLGRYFRGPGAVPRLVELARDASRQAICLVCERKSSCQFYTVLRRCKLPPAVERIITYVKPIYL